MMQQFAPAHILLILVPMPLQHESDTVVVAIR